MLLPPRTRAVALLLASAALCSATVVLTPPPNDQSTRIPPNTLNAIWHEGPGQDWYTGAFPIGNGYLGETILGNTSFDSHFINIATLWVGGPFRNSSYSAGNGPVSSKPAFATALADARAEIAATGNGSVDGLMRDLTDPDYGSFTTAGVINITSSSVQDEITSYTRVLDFDQGLMNITWTEGGVAFTRISFCSFPDNVCVTHTSANASSLELGYALSTPLDSVPAATCANSTLTQRGRASCDTDGVAQAMLYQVNAQVGATSGNVTCSDDGSVSVSGTNESWIIWTGKTDFKLENCNRAANFSCRGDDPSAAVTSRLASATTKSFADLLSAHVKDYSALAGAFKLDIGQAANETAASIPTDQLVNAYDFNAGSPLLEHNVYSFGRHLLISSARARPGFIPPNLQGIWSQTAGAPWGGDFHYDINLQMMQWSGESTGIAEGIVNTGNWVQYAMVDHGEDTADILYNISTGHIYHTSSNLFGYTGMQGLVPGTPPEYHPEWADLTGDSPWVLQHLYDHFIYNPSDAAYLKDVSYPLMKSQAQFQMAFLVNDTHFNDSTLVISPCNSPEQVYVTLGCTFNQQQIFELLHNIRKLSDVVGDDDTEFLTQVESTLDKMYDGIRIGSWGQLQEWKVDHDDPTDQHRHLSHLLGVYPGWQISGYLGESLGNESVVDAAKISLAARGNGSVDSDAGWEKVMRSVVASSLHNASHAAFEYRFMIWSNLNGNLLSMYSGHSSVFQMDANGGAPAAIINMLFQSLDSTKEFRNITHVNLLPALPDTWESGSFTGGRLRDGLGIDLAWSEGAISSFTLKADRVIEDRAVMLHSASFDGKHVKASSGRPLQNGTSVAIAIAKGNSIDFTVS